MNEIPHLLKNRQLKAAIEQLKACAPIYKEVNAAERIERIADDYSRMLDYMERGYKDDSRATLYEKLRRETYRLDADMTLLDTYRSTSFFSNALYQANKARWDEEIISFTLENFVSDVAMLSLEPEETRLEKSRQLHRRHGQFMEVLFRKLWLAFMWTEHEAQFWERLLLSPTIDSNDAQLLVSALTLSLLQQYDVRKFRTLVNIYCNTNDQRLRQRALVGWAFNMDADTTLFPEHNELIGQLCNDEAVGRELLELQMQVFFCLNAEQDRDRIQKDIMPTLLKNNNLKITRFGIEEKEDDPMQDILDPGAADRAMEEMENTVGRMMDMQKKGVDIYFGGFSMMKSFPFFGDMAHWFTPFYKEHTALNNINDKLRGTVVMDSIVENGPFCDSDKYSFALAVTQVIDRLPDNMKELLASSDMLGPVAPKEETQTAAYIRRMYLQDLYRFYRLFPQRDLLPSPFDAKGHAAIKAFFYTLKALKNTRVEDNVTELATFLANHNRMKELHQLCSNFLYDNSNSKLTSDVRLLILAAKACEMADNGKAGKLYEKALELDNDNETALRGLGQRAFEQEDYEKAEQYYSRLVELNPKKSHQLSYCITLLKNKKTEEAMKAIYKLDYEHPDDLNVRRAKAWGLMQQGRLQQAQEEYAAITADSRAVDADLLNSGYCEWFLGNIHAALDCFRNYIAMKNEKDYELKDDFEHDRDTLSEHGISEMDMVLMLDLI